MSAPTRAAETYATALKRLAREQDAAEVSRGVSGDVDTMIDVALSTTRGEAANSGQALYLALEPGSGTAGQAADQTVALYDSARSIASATLLTWAGFWRGWEGGT